MKSTVMSLIIIISAYAIFFAFFKFGRMTRDAKDSLGKSVVIGKDTLTIIDYSFNSHTFTMNNGLKVDIDLVESRIGKK